MADISLKELRARLQQEQPDNSDRANGFALVNVLQPEEFLSEHIPGSINIPKGNEREFEKLFDHTKELVLYCASTDCPASSQVAKVLYDLGFSNIRRFEGGMRAWSEGNNQIESGKSSSQEMSIA